MGAIRSCRSLELAELNGSNELVELAGAVTEEEEEGVGSRSRMPKLAKVAPADPEVVVFVEPQSPNGSKTELVCGGCDCAGCDRGGCDDRAGCDGGGRVSIASSRLSPSRFSSSTLCSC